MSRVADVPLEDVQGQSDHRELPIDEVGICDLRHPVGILDREGGVQTTVATVSATVDLAAELRGTHMSRFVRVLGEHVSALDSRSCLILAEELRRSLHSSRATVGLEFPYFIERMAPVSELRALVDVEARIEALAGDAAEVRIGVKVPVTSLCPCSREISDYGAHNQRGQVVIDVVGSGEQSIWFEDLVEIADVAASAPIYSLLKRVDERHVTMQAYDNPAFVEDIARDVAVALKADTRIAWYTVRVVNQESIHNHNAVAVIRGFGAA